MPVKNQTKVQMRPLSGRVSTRGVTGQQKSTSTSPRVVNSRVVKGSGQLAPNGHRSHKSPEAKRTGHSVSPLRAKLTPQHKKGGAKTPATYNMGVFKAADTNPALRRRWRSKTPRADPPKTPTVRLSDTWKTSGCPRRPSHRVTTPTSDLGTTASSNNSWPRRRSGEDHVDNDYSDVRYTTDFTSSSDCKDTKPSASSTPSRSIGSFATPPRRSPYNSSPSISLSSGTPWNHSNSSRPGTGNTSLRGRGVDSLPSTTGYSSASSSRELAVNSSGHGSQTRRRPSTSVYSGSRGGASKRSNATYDKRSGRSPMFPVLSKDACTETTGCISDGFDEIIKALHDEVISLKQTQMICRTDCMESILTYETKLVDEKNEFSRQLKAFQDYEKENNMESKQKKLLSIMKIEEQIRRQIIMMEEQEGVLVNKESQIYEREKSIKSYSDEMDNIESYLDRRKEIAERKADELKSLEEELRLTTSEQELINKEALTKKGKSGWARARDALLSQKIVLEMALKRLSKEAQQAQLNEVQSKKKISDLNNTISDMDKTSKTKDRKISNLENRLDLLTFEQQKFQPNSNFYR